MTHDYPTSDDLAAMGKTLLRDVNLCSNELRAWFGLRYARAVWTKAEPEPTPERDRPPARLHRRVRLGGKRIV